MKPILSIALALACLGVPSTFYAADQDPVVTTSDAPDEAVYEFEAVVGDSGTVQILLAPGQTVGEVKMPGFELADPINQKVTDPSTGIEYTIVTYGATAKTAGVFDVSFAVLNADGTVDHTVRGHATIHEAEQP